MVYKITFDGEKYKTSLVNKICQLKGQQKKTYEGDRVWLWHAGWMGKSASW